MKLQTGDILLVDSNSLIAKIIKFFTQSNWSHAAIMVNEYLGYEANFPKVEPFDVIKYIDLLMKRKVNEVIVLRHKKLKNITPEQANRLIKSIRIGVYHGYDVGGLLAYLFRKRRFQSKKKWFCSEIIAHAYASLGIAIGREEHEWEVSPDTIYRDSDFEILGNLEEFGV